MSVIADIVLDEGNPRTQAVLSLADYCRYEVEHTHQVARLALALFDDLQPLHGLGEEDRYWLQCAALLHDIGWVEGQKGHHKVALKVILDTTLLPFSTRERYIIGSIARYHRKALPSEDHAHFASLCPEDRQLVCVLSAILRVADGLDRTHRGLVRELSCAVLPERILIHCVTERPAASEVRMALSKGDLLVSLSGRGLDVICAVEGHDED